MISYIVQIESASEKEREKPFSLRNAFLNYIFESITVAIACTLNTHVNLYSAEVWADLELFTSGMRRASIKSTWCKNHLTASA